MSLFENQGVDIDLYIEYLLHEISETRKKLKGCRGTNVMLALEENYLKNLNEQLAELEYYKQKGVADFSPRNELRGRFFVWWKNNKKDAKA